MPTTDGGPVTAASRSPEEKSPDRRTKDSRKTRQLLVDAAFRRFACDGYAATTVRDIAVDAGVNVALINRYFQSKEGLFEACLKDAVHELSRITVKVSDLNQIPDAIIRPDASGGSTDLVIRLLLRSTGEPNVERIRFGLLRTFSEHLAALAGWHAGDPNSDGLLLRAQLVLALSIGLTVLRASPGLEPLASVAKETLLAPIGDVVDTLLSNSLLAVDP